MGVRSQYQVGSTCITTTKGVHFMSFTMSFRTGKDGEPVYGERPQYREEFLKKVYDGSLNITAELGEMFTDFISMEGDIATSNHPFILADGDTCEGITSDSHFLVQLREYIDLGIENKNFFEESCFMFFLESQNLHLPAMHYTPVIKEGQEDACVEDFIEDNEDMSPLEKMMRGYVAAKDKIYDVPLTTYECETVEDACIASLHFLITHDCNILKCQNCRKYFISARSDTKYCDRISPFNKRTTCKKDGPQRAHKDNVRADELKQAIKLKKNKLYMRTFRNQDNLELDRYYQCFLNNVKEKQNLLNSGAITTEQFMAWLDKQ